MVYKANKTTDNLLDKKQKKYYSFTKQPLGIIMGLSKSSREDILKCSIILFKLNGYNNTTMANIADECGLIKGSLYHHFKSKDEIGLESLKYIHDYFNRSIFNIAYIENISDKEKMEIFVKKNDEYFLHSQGGCLLGNFALEVAASNVNFKNEIQEYFLDWEKALTHILTSKYGLDKANEISKELVALTQGEIMMMNLYNTPLNYLKVGKKMIQLLD